MRIVVTGGAGFIGSHVAEVFIEAGHEVMVLDDLSRGREPNIPKGASFVKADIVRDDLTRIFNSFRPQAVCHHAAQISVRDSVADPFTDMRINIEGMLRTLEASRESGVEYFIFASTGGALYGDQQEYPARETHPTYPLSPYGISKLAGEKYLYFYRKQYGIKGIALRYSNVYGPRQDPHGEAGVVAIFCLAIAEGRSPTINGDGMQTRDFVFVRDVAKANLLALEKRAEGEFNIGSGVETNINQIAEKIAKFARSNIPFRHGPPKPGEQMRSVLDYSLAEKVLGWKPETDIDTGIKKTWEFFSQAGAKTF